MRLLLEKLGMRNRVRPATARGALDRGDTWLGRERRLRSGFRAASVFFSSLLLLFASGEPTAAQQSAWQDNFNGSTPNASRWAIASGWAPGYLAGNHVNLNDPTHVRVRNGFLVIALTQEGGAVDGAPGVISKGGMIYTRSTDGYGTYEWRMRMSSTALAPTRFGTSVSGSVSAGFNWVNNSETEIDFEFSANVPGWVFLSNFNNLDPLRAPTPDELTTTVAAVPDISANFKTYKMVWEEEKITFYIDDVFQTSHVTNIPSAPAYFIFSHWGTNDPLWGGAATVGITRYVYVDWVRFTPAP